MATIRETEIEIKSGLRTLKQNKQMMLAIASQAYALMNERVWEKNQTANGSMIGRYTNDAYKRQRFLLGRQNAKVDLNFTGIMRKAFTFGLDGNDGVVGFADVKRTHWYQPYSSKNGTTKKKGAIKRTPDDTTNAEVAAFLEERYGTIFTDLTDAEDKKIDQIVDEFTDKLF